MKNLTEYVERLNAMNKIFNRPTIDLDNLTDDMAQDIFNSLDGDLSPENLHCDGEISAAQARKKAKLFYAAANELMALGFRSNEKWSEFA